MELKANRIGGEGTARQPGPLDRALALLDVLFTGAAVVVEGDDVLGWPRQVGDDEADPRAQLAGMPLDLAHDAPQFLPARSSLVRPGRSCPCRGNSQEQIRARTAVIACAIKEGSWFLWKIRLCVSGLRSGRRGP
jgi:hypothetical protein